MIKNKHHIDIDELLESIESDDISYDPILYGPKVRKAIKRIGKPIKRSKGDRMRFLRDEDEE